MVGRLGIALRHQELWREDKAVWLQCWALVGVDALEEVRQMAELDKEVVAAVGRDEEQRQQELFGFVPRWSRRRASILAAVGIVE